MQQGTRKFLANERSVPKQSKPSYQYVMLNQKDAVLPYYGQYSGKKQLHKISSDAELMRNSKVQQFKNPTLRRRNDDQQRNNLKFELQNLKNEVSRLITRDKDSLLRTPIKQKSQSISVKQQPLPGGSRKINYVSKQFQCQLQQFTDRQDDFSDTASMTSVTTQKILNQPLRKLQKKASGQNYQSSYYMQLQNDLLKTEIRNLKNKYVSKKRQLSQKCQLLEKKVEFLQVSLHQSQQALAESRNALEMEIMTIKRQITLRAEMKSDVHKPQSDRPTTTNSSQQESDNNQMLQEKLRKLYQQVSDKNKRISTLIIQLGDMQSILEKKKFDLKKQSQKSFQLSKQLQLSKRQLSRLQILIQTQLNKKKDLIKQNQMLKVKNRQLMEEIYKKEKIVVGSEQYETRMVQEIQGYRKREDEMQERLTLLKDESKKLKQVVQTNNDEIATLKKAHDQSLSKLSQLSKKLKQQQQLSEQRQLHYHQLLQQSKLQQQQKLRIMKQQYQSQFSALNSSQQQQSNAITTETNQLVKQKERQINKWKAEYKILKLKYQERHRSEGVRKEEGEKYYKSYVQFKTKLSLLTDRNKLLEVNLEGYRRKLNDKISQAAKQELQHEKAIKSLTSEMAQLNHQIQNLNDQLILTKNQLNELIPKNEQQIRYRQEIQSKIQTLIHKRLFSDQESQQSGTQQIQEKQIEEPNQSESPQVESSNRFLEDEQFDKSPSKESVKKYNKKSPSNIKVNNPIQLSQSQKLHLEQLSDAITAMKKRVIQQDEKLAKNVRQLKNKDAQIAKLKKQIRQLLQAHEQELSEIKIKCSEQKAQKLLKSISQSQRSLKQLCQNQISNYNSKFTQLLTQSVQMKRQISQLQGQVVDLRQQTRSLSHLYNVKCAEVEEFIQRTLTELAVKDGRLDEMNYMKQQREGNLLNQIALLKDQVSTLRGDIRNLLVVNQKIQVRNFDQALRNQIQTSNTLRSQLAKKNQQIYKVRDNYTALRSQFDNLRSQVQIQKLKNLSQRKNIQIQYQVQMQNLKNKQNFDEKRIASLEQKIALVIEENKKKDSFIQSYIMGKKLPSNQKELLATFMKQYEISLNGNSINQKLRADSHELEKMAAYNYRLLKDLAQMKEKMLLYQTMEGEALSFYDSKNSGEFKKQLDFDSPSFSLDSSPERSGAKFKKMLSLND